MPLPTFLALITLVLLAGGASVFLVQLAGLPLGLASLAALTLAYLVKVRLWL